MAISSSDGIPFSATALDVLGTAAELAKQTNRGRITSSCLLFALAEFGSSYITKFVRQSLNRNNRYKEAFEAFVKDGGPSTNEPVTLPGLDWGLSRNMGKALANASDWAVQTTGSNEVHTRHLFASLISPLADTGRAVHKRLERLGVDLPTLCAQFREHVSKFAPFDDAGAWNDILGYTLIPEPQPDPDTPTPTTPVEQAATADAPAHKSGTYSIFIPDRTSYAPRADGIPLDDSLGVRTYASHLAQLIAAKETFMPLSIGLFGAWGAGKSHFIDLLGEELQSLTTDPSGKFHKEIVQIKFNAWHYLDTNLWANLVSEIFEQLFNKVEDRGAKEKEKVKNLKKKLADQSALADEARAAVRLAAGARRGAENKLRAAMQERAKQETRVSRLLNDLTQLVRDDDLKKQLREVATALGLPRLESSYQELEARAEEVQSIGGRTRALVLAVFTGPGWWKRAFLLVVALAVPLFVSWLSLHGTKWITDLLSGAGKTIAEVTTAILALSTWLAAQVKTGNSIVGKLETAYSRVQKVREKREAEDEASKAQAELAKRVQAEEQARRTLQEAEDKLKTIRTELTEMAPGRQLIRFLRARATAEDYRRHLGLVSLVRKDFEQLSTLLMSAADPKEPLPKIDRIVLYIDDLDRCRADRVIEVLEAVHLLLAFQLFAVIVAVDPRWLRQSLLDHYPRLLGGAQNEKTNSRTRSLGRPATPQDYLEKIFQVPFHLHAMEKPGFDALVKVLFTVEQSNGTDSTPPANVLNSQSESQDPVQNEEEQDVGREKPAGDGSPSGQPAVLSGVGKVQESPPPAPERLLLTTNEVKDVERFQLLFQTPRALKRFANTYALIRVGVDEKNWASYLGFNGSPPAYRVPLLLLAVTSAFPSLARPCLLWLGEKPPAKWQLEESDIDVLTGKYSDTTDREDWLRLKASLNSETLDGWPLPDRESLEEWVPRVARYSF